MRQVKSKDSKIEVKLRLALWHKGYRYRKNDKTVYGKPDLTFKRKKVAVFVDGEFWHGYDWEHRKNDFKSNKEFWINKIERNMERDREVNKYLTENGWTVLRFWGSDIKNNLDDCVNAIIKELI